MSRFAQLAPMLLALVATACATGDDGISPTTFGGPGGGASAGDESGSTGEIEDESGDDDDSMPMTSSGGSADGTTGGEGGDDGNPLCCEVGAQAGCDSPTTEACVCTSQPACCQAVWSQECVDLAIACEDPYCADEESEGTGTTGGGVELECDMDFSFVPPNPAPGVPFTARFTDPDGLTYVGITAQGPGGTVMGQHTGHTGTGPFTWSFDYDGLEAGVWTFSFTHHQQANDPDIIQGTCDKQF